MWARLIDSLWPWRQQPLAGVTWVVLLAWPGAVGANQAPVVDGLAALPAVVLPGETATLTVEAHDPDCLDSCTSGCGLYIRSDLTAWTATGGSFVSQDNGTSSSPYVATAEWQAPGAEGTYTVTVELDDSGSFLCGGRESGSANLLIQVTTSPNEPPVVDSLTAVPPVVFVGESSALSCVATDPEGEPLTYTWQTDLGTVTPGTGGSATFSADEPGIATILCTATDPGGASGSGSVLVSVQGAQPETTLVAGLVAPQRLASDSLADLYVVDAGQGLAVVHMEHGELVYRIPLAGAAAVEVDWNDHLLVGGTFGLQVISRAGELLQTLAGGSPGRDVADVAVAPVDRLYAVLYRRSGRVQVYDDQGGEVLSFGSTGEGPEQFKSPQGLAAARDGVLPAAGRWVVADTGNGRLKVFDANGTLVNAFGGPGGGVGEFVQLDDVAVSEDGIIYASDSFQDWVQSFNSDGSPREILGTYGEGLGEFKTATGLTVAEDFDRLVVASTNSSSLQVFRTDPNPTTPPGQPLGVAAPTALDFGSQSVDSTSPWQTVVLSNGGARPLGLLQLATSGDFSHAHDCPAFLDAGASCTAQVSFAPRIPGPRTGALTVEISWGAPLAVGLSGSAYAPPDVALSPSAIFFPDQLVATVSEEEPILLTNTGTVSLAIAAINVSGDFGFLSACPAQLPGGTGCEILASFTPLSVGDEILGTLSVVSDAAGSPHEVALGGASYGGSGIISVADAEVEESEAEARFTVRLSDVAEGPVTASYRTLEVTAKEGEDYLPVVGTVTLAPGDTEIEVLVPVVDDPILEPESESFMLELFDPIGADLGIGLGEATILDDELCLGPNLLVNASAEEADGPGGIPGWETPLQSMAWTVGQPPPDPVDGNQFFYAGTAPRAEIFQDVAVGAYATAIDAGTALFGLDGWVRSGFERGPDSVRVVAEYRDATNTTVLDSFDSGEVVSVADWLLVSDVRAAPAGTRWIRLRLLAEQYSGPQTDALVDALELRSIRVPTVIPADASLDEGDVGTSTMSFDLQLACPYWQPVAMEFDTTDDSATAGEDYLETQGSLIVEAGMPSGEIPVEIIGDELEERDEQFFLDISLGPTEDAVLLRPTATGTILDDDGTVEPPSWWRLHPEAWPDALEVADEVWDAARIEEALAAVSADPVIRLARELTAARLNLAAGASRGILPVVVRAEKLLTALAASGQGAGGRLSSATKLAAALEAYNTGRPARRVDR